jgi:hypothetical protein
MYRPKPRLIRGAFRRVVAAQRRRLMKRHGKWNVDIERDEQPDYNFYHVTFYDRPSVDAAARVHARVYTNFGESAKEVHVERLKPDALQNIDDSELVEIAEIEVNCLPEFQEYVLFPTAISNPFHKEHF